MNTGIRRIGIAMIALFVVLVAQLTYLQVVRSDHLANAAGNPRKAFSDIRRDRGPIETSDGAVVALSTPSNDEFKHQRVYPNSTAELFADVVGYESIQNGSTGVEAAYSADLEGRTFDLQFNNIADALANKQPVGTVVLTLSKEAQGAAAFALQGRRGSVVVLDVKTGGVLAAYSNPTYDPNQLATHDTNKAQAAYSVLTNAPDNPMLARAWRELYPPGSTFKTVTAYVPKGQPTHVNSLTKKLPWNTDPPSNGQHYPQWAVWGFYTQAVNPRMVVHDEEHGGVIYWWGPQVPAATVTQLRALYNEQPVGTFGTPYAGLGAKIAITAWTGNPSTYQQNGDYGQGHIGICTRYTAATHTAFQAFRKAYRGHGPEGIPLSADHPGMGP